MTVTVQSAVILILSYAQICSNVHISSEPNSLSLKQDSLFADISLRAANALHYAE